MKNTAIVCLVVLNALLLAGFVGRVSSTSSTSSGVAFAQAQPARPVARPSDYLLIPGELTAGSAAVIYAIDTSNGWLSAFAYDDANRRVDAMPGRIDLASVFSGNVPIDGNRSRTGRGN